MIDRDHPPRPVVRNCLFAFEVLRRLGFPSEAISFGCVNVVGLGPATVATLTVDGKKWQWDLDTIDSADIDAIEAELVEAIAFWSGPGNETVPWGYLESPFNNMYVDVTLSIMNKGIAVPVAASIIPRGYGRRSRQ